MKKKNKQTPQTTHQIIGAILFLLIIIAGAIYVVKENIYYAKQTIELQNKYNQTCRQLGFDGVYEGFPACKGEFNRATGQYKPYYLTDEEKTRYGLENIN